MPLTWRVKYGPQRSICPHRLLRHHSGRAVMCHTAVVGGELLKVPFTRGVKLTVQPICWQSLKLNLQTCFHQRQPSFGYNMPSWRTMHSPSLWSRVPSWRIFLPEQGVKKGDIMKVNELPFLQEEGVFMKTMPSPFLRRGCRHEGRCTHFPSVEGCIHKGFPSEGGKDAHPFSLSFFPSPSFPSEGGWLMKVNALPFLQEDCVFINCNALPFLQEDGVFIKDNELPFLQEDCVFIKDNALPFLQEDCVCI